MFIETTRKIRLNDEEKEALNKAQKIVDDIFYKMANLKDKIDIEDDVADTLDDLQATINTII